MSKILEMIKNEKVEWKKLGEIGVISGAGVNKKVKEDEKSIILLNYMDVYKNLYINSDIPQMKVTASDKKIEDCNIKYGDIFITPSSEIKEDIFMSSVAVEDFENTVYSYHIMRIRLKEKNFITSCFLNYIFRSVEFRKKMQKKVFGNTRQTITKTEIEKLEVPIPSINTQEKIVEILDKFVKYSTELQAELQAELQNRSSQYEYFRDLVLSKDYLIKLSLNPEINPSKLRQTTLGEIGKFTRGNGLQKKDFVLKGKPVIHYGQIYTEYGFQTNKANSFVKEEVFNKLKKANKKDILISTTSENIEDVGKSLVWLGDEEVGFSGDMYSYKTNENSKYIAYFFQSYNFQKQKKMMVSGTKVIRLHENELSKIKLTLPPIEIQNKVVEVLDKFQNLISDAEGLLPEEIEQRQKQYEYYREKLLTFENIMVQVKSSQVKSSSTL